MIYRTLVTSGHKDLCPGRSTLSYNDLLRHTFTPRLIDNTIDKVDRPDTQPVMLSRINYPYVLSGYGEAFSTTLAPWIEMNGAIMASRRIHSPSFMMTHDTQPFEPAIICAQA
eukprot:TRINITY_DN10075_c0_g1_i2.p2 TRINITY_DN10075_c0_g1~~TRINITY_DN10075_c0_g1_i2.p2  ORF type:complete len:113 (-),score=1.09 TRINITY_DN10075_c0_g1_i2:901-1239(-)